MILQLKEGRLENEELDIFKNAEDFRQLEIFAVRLTDGNCEYEPEDIARYAISKGYASKLGYLAELSIKAAESLRFPTERLEKLVELLYDNKNKTYEFLFPYDSSDKSRQVIKNIESSEKNITELNKKWGIYSFATSDEIKEYLELYLSPAYSQQNGK